MYFYHSSSNTSIILSLLVKSLRFDSLFRTLSISFGIAQTRHYILVYDFLRFIFEQLLILLLNMFSQFLRIELGHLIITLLVVNFKLWLESCLDYRAVVAIF